MPRTTNPANKEFYEALLASGLSQKELAERAGCKPIVISHLMSMYACPDRVTCDCIEAVFRFVGVIFNPLLFWPAGFKGKHNVQRQERLARVKAKREQAAIEKVSTLVEVKEPPAEPSEAVEKRELSHQIMAAIATLTPRQSLVLLARYFEEKSLKQIGALLGVQNERVRQIEAEALKRIRHPSRIGELKDFCN